LNIRDPLFLHGGQGCEICKIKGPAKTTGFTLQYWQPNKNKQHRETSNN